MFTVRRATWQSTRQLHTASRILGAESNNLKQGKLFLGFVSPLSPVAAVYKVRNNYPTPLEPTTACNSRSTHVQCVALCHSCGRCRAGNSQRCRWYRLSCQNACSLSCRGCPCPLNVAQLQVAINQPPPPLFVQLHQGGLFISYTSRNILTENGDPHFTFTEYYRSAHRG